MRVSTIERHPMRERIVEALASGQKLREITAWASPSVTVMALSRFRSHAISITGKALSDAKAAIAIQGCSVTDDGIKSVTKAAMTAAIDPFVAAAVRSQARRERWMDDLEAQPEIDSYRVLATLDKNDLVAQEYHARLAGRLDASQGNQTNNLHVYVSIPRGAGAEDVRPAIEVKPTE